MNKTIISDEQPNGSIKLIDIMQFINRNKISEEDIDNLVWHYDFLPEHNIFEYIYNAYYNNNIDIFIRLLYRIDEHIITDDHNRYIDKYMNSIDIPKKIIEECKNMSIYKFKKLFNYMSEDLNSLTEHYFPFRLGYKISNIILSDIVDNILSNDIKENELDLWYNKYFMSLFDKENYIDLNGLVEDRNQDFYDMIIILSFNEKYIKWLLNKNEVIDSLLSANEDFDGRVYGMFRVIISTIKGMIISEDEELYKSVKFLEQYNKQFDI